MKHLTFYFDVISPYAHLAFEHMPQALVGLSYHVEYKPVLFAGLLGHWGQKGPAEIDPKRAWTYRQVAWLAKQHGVRMDMPAAHPFNPLPFLRLIVAAGASRHTVEAAFRHVWHGGLDASDAHRLRDLQQRLAPARDAASDDVKAELRHNTQAAIDEGVFGVPTLLFEGKHFFGLDGLPMLAAAMRGDAWFNQGGAWDAAAKAPVGTHRAEVSKA
jgi:2-hydroxychromene-2-carboxylate isomerase